MKNILHYPNLLYILEIICIEIIICYYNDSLTDHFVIKKTKELVIKKHFWPSLQKNIEAYVKVFNIYLTLKIVCNKLLKYF